MLAGELSVTAEGDSAIPPSCGLAYTRLVASFSFVETKLLSGLDDKESKPPTIASEAEKIPTPTAMSTSSWCWKKTGMFLFVESRFKNRRSECCGLRSISIGIRKRISYLLHVPYR